MAHQTLETLTVANVAHWEEDERKTCQNKYGKDRQEPRAQMVGLEAQRIVAK
jgi:hypothetical protein